MSALHANFARSYLAEALTDVATTLALVEGTGALFPAPTGGDWAWLVLDDGVVREIVKCTGRATDTLTVERAQEGTSAAAFEAATTVELRYLASEADSSANAVQKNIGYDEVAVGGFVVTEVDGSLRRIGVAGASVLVVDADGGFETIEVSDLPAAIGLGDAALLSVGTSPGTVAAGDDERFGGYSAIKRHILAFG